MVARTAPLPLLLLVFTAPVRADSPPVLPGTRPLELDVPLDELMVDGINRFALREIERSVERRKRHWNRDYSSHEAYEKSVEPNRERLRRYLGVVDERVKPDKGLLHPLAEQGKIVSYPVRWPVLDGVTLEGLLVVPPKEPRALVVALPDANSTPEALMGYPGSSSWMARHLAEQDCLVVVPTLISRDNEFSGNPVIGFTNQPHREWVYRPAFQMGRTVAGYEVQKVLAVVDLFEEWARKAGELPIGVCGVGEGGGVALYAAALDTRIDGAHVAGYFAGRDNVWKEAIDHNVWRLLDEFGDGEIASLVAPRPLVIDIVPGDTWDGPVEVPGRRNGAAPGRIARPTIANVRGELGVARRFYRQLGVADRIALVDEDEWHLGTHEFLRQLGVEPRAERPRYLGDLRGDTGRGFRFRQERERERRQLTELTDHVQRLLDESAGVRYEFWKNGDRGRSKSMTPDEWEAFAESYRDHVHDELIGRLPEPTMPVNPRSRKVLDEPTHTGYEVLLDVYPDVVAGGILLVPKDLEEGERRAVVVCQHGLEGRAVDTITTDETSRAWRSYKGFATQLVKRGFVVYSPQNPYRGGDRFRSIQRKSNPLGRSLFSYVVRQHERTLEWLATQPFVDADRIGFYGLSYGGKTAMRVPALLPPREGRPGYCLSICSADFNEWVRKCVTDEARYSYVFTGEYEMFEWNMGHVANYAELAMLISPRPFMVERGHDDGVAPDEWVAWEYAKVRRHYTKLGIPERTEIEWFDGPHTINAQGTFRFLHRHLKWPEPEGKK